MRLEKFSVAGEALVWLSVSASVWFRSLTWLFTIGLSRLYFSCFPKLIITWINFWGNKSCSAIEKSKSVNQNSRVQALRNMTQAF